ncbi:MAG: ABC transporter ATP-binding protein [Lachnospiraceae bacterium]
MIGVIAKQVKEYKIPSIVTPILMIGEVIAEMTIPVLMGRIVDEGIYGGSMDYILHTGLIMLAVALGGLLCGVGGAFFGAMASTGLAKNLRKAMNDNIQRFSFANIDHFSTSSLVTRLTTDTTNIQNAFQMILRMAMRAPASIIVAMIMSFSISARLSSVYLVAVIVLGVVIFVVSKTTMKYFRAVFERYDALNASVQENVNAIRVVKAYVREDYEIGKFKKAAINIYLMFMKAELRMAVMSPVMQAAVYGSILTISWLGAQMIVSSELTTGNLMSLLTYCMNILMSLMMLSFVIVMIKMSAASARRIAEVIEEEPSLKNPENPVMTIPDGSVEFDHVSFRYNTNGGGEDVLKDITFSVKSGENIGVVGATGSAKSTMVSLISRLYDVTAGSVKVGGRDVREYDMKALRDAVSVVLQKNVLFSGTIYDNLRWGDKNATDEECRHACELACASEFIEKMPDKYNTMISQGGTNVSGGQKQRLCIARALLKKPKILILDDSTSAVDTATDAKIREAFLKEIPNTTRFVIAQRVSSVEHCDRILVMNNGQIDGFDTPENLLKNNTIYREMYESQKGIGGDGDFDEKN